MNLLDKLTADVARLQKIIGPTRQYPILDDVWARVQSTDPIGVTYLGDDPGSLVICDRSTVDVSVGDLVLVRRQGTARWILGKDPSASARIIGPALRLSGMSSTASTSQVFQTVAWDSVDQNSGGWVGSSDRSTWTVPISGMYQVNWLVRIKDGTIPSGGLLFYQVIKDSAGDPPGEQWLQIPGALRAVAPYSALRWFQAGDQIHFEYYSDGVSPVFAGCNAAIALLR